MKGALGRESCSSLTWERWNRFWFSALRVRFSGRASGARQGASEISSPALFSAEYAAMGQRRRPADLVSSSTKGGMRTKRSKLEDRRQAFLYLGSDRREAVWRRAPTDSWAQALEDRAEAVTAAHTAGLGSRAIHGCSCHWYWLQKSVRRIFRISVR